MTTEPHRRPLPLVLTAIAAVIALAGTTWLWAEAGAVIFFETIRAGFVALCG
jgi:hypothetical protein